MNAIVALLPILLLFVLMLALKVSAWKSAVISLICAIILALFVTPQLGMLPERFAGVAMAELVGWSLVEGLFKGVYPILFIILMAIYSYNVVVSSGGIETIKRMFADLTDDRGVLVLIMALGFAGILEAMAGFGTSVAIPAAILISLGFKPIFSALVSLLGNTVTGCFGALGVPINLLANEVSADGTASSALISVVAQSAAIQLLPLFILIPFAILMLADRSAWKRNIILSLWSGGLSWVSQFFCARYLGLETPGIVGSVVTIFSLIAWIKVFGKKKRRQGPRVGLAEGLRAWSVYLFILGFILLTGPLVPMLHDLLAKIPATEIDIPVLGSKIRYHWMNSAPVWLFAGTLAGGLCQGMSCRTLGLILIKTFYQLRFTFITIVSLVAMASVMSTSGMIATLAISLVSIAGSLYPLFAPFVGAIGTIVTGSHTSSNILFGKLQAGVAEQLGLNGQMHILGVEGTKTEWVAAANVTGATGGKLVSPQTIAIATASCDMSDEDEKILVKAAPYAVAYILIGGVMVWLGTIL
ncbi:MAG: L-lactate permease [Bacteroidales bacterium]|nr:L-lactate permease [Bacteroidales bacterium]